MRNNSTYQTLMYIAFGLQKNQGAVFEHQAIELLAFPSRKAAPTIFLSCLDSLRILKKVCQMAAQVNIFFISFQSQKVERL